MSGVKKITFMLFVTALLIVWFMPCAIAAPGGVMVGKTFYISGQGDRRPDGTYPDTYPERVRQCMENIRANLKKSGLDMENIVKTFVYLDDIDKFPEMNKVYRTYFKKDPPARTTLSVDWIPGGSQIEITCIAYSDLSGKKAVGGEGAFNLPFSVGIIAGKTLYLAGQGDHLPDGTRPEKFEDQARQCMHWVEQGLKAAGLDWRHVVWSTIFMDKVAYENQGIFNKVYSEYFEYGNEPARANVFVEGLPVESHIEVTCFATTDLSLRKVVRPKSMRYGPDGKAPTASPGVWLGDTLYLSEQIGTLPTKGLIANGLEAQTHLMMDNHLEVLREAGLRFDNLVSGNVYLLDGNDYQAFNKIYFPYFNPYLGVRTCLQPNSGYMESIERVKTHFIFAREKK